MRDRESPGCMLALAIVLGLFGLCCVVFQSAYIGGKHTAPGWVHGASVFWLGLAFLALSGGVFANLMLDKAGKKHAAGVCGLLAILLFCGGVGVSGWLDSQRRHEEHRRRHPQAEPHPYHRSGHRLPNIWELEMRRKEQQRRQPVAPPTPTRPAPAPAP